MAGPAPIAGAVAPSSATADLSSLLGGAAVPGNGMQQQQAQLEQLMGNIRTIGQQVQALATNYPELGQLAGQVNDLLKQMVVTAAAAAQMQTASSLALPGAGGGTPVG